MSMLRIVGSNADQNFIQTSVQTQLKPVLGSTYNSVTKAKILNYSVISEYKVKLLLTINSKEKLKQQFL